MPGGLRPGRRSKAERQGQRRPRRPLRRPGSRNAARPSFLVASPGCLLFGEPWAGERGGGTVRSLSVGQAGLRQDSLGGMAFGRDAGRPCRIRRPCGGQAQCGVWRLSGELSGDLGCRRTCLRLAARHPREEAAPEGAEALRDDGVSGEARSC